MRVLGVAHALARRGAWYKKTSRAVTFSNENQLACPSTTRGFRCASPRRRMGTPYGAAARVDERQMFLRHLTTHGRVVHRGPRSSCRRRPQSDVTGKLVDAPAAARLARRRPLSTGTEPSFASPRPPPPPPPPPPKAGRELEFPPPPPLKRGPIIPPADPLLSGDESAATSTVAGGRGGGKDGSVGGVPVPAAPPSAGAAAAGAAPGVTVDATIGGGDVHGPATTLFKRSDNNLEKQGGGGGGGGGRVEGDSGKGAVSLDDAWVINGGATDGAGGPTGTPADTASAAPLELCGGGNRGVGQLGEAGSELALRASSKEQRKATRPGDERAHKMWVTGNGVGDTVSEVNWKADLPSGSGKEDTAVIQFHSESEIGHRRFEGLGVVKKDKAEDIRTLVDSFTAPALAAALRDRETALHACAHLLETGDLEGVRKKLLPFTANQVAKSRRELKRLDLDPEGFTKVHMYTLRKVLQRLPRHVTTLTEQRASVMIPLCNVDGVASVLFTKRSSTMRAHKNEVCFPGGKVDIGLDQHIIQTALREMGEEIGILESSVDVLGVLRCDWAELASLIGVAVTPVVGFLGNLSRDQINPNPDEVSHCFTIPIRLLLQQDRWKLEKYHAPAFEGGPYQIWGLTGYILHRLVNDVIRQHLVVM